MFTVDVYVRPWRARIVRLVAPVVVCALVMGACGGSGDDDPFASEQSQPSPTAVPPAVIDDNASNETDDGDSEGVSIALPTVPPAADAVDDAGTEADVTSDEPTSDDSTSDDSTSDDSAAGVGSAAGTRASDTDNTAGAAEEATVEPTRTPVAASGDESGDDDTDPDASPTSSIPTPTVHPTSTPFVVTYITATPIPSATAVPVATATATPIPLVAPAVPITLPTPGYGSAQTDSSG